MKTLPTGGSRLHRSSIGTDSRERAGLLRRMPHLRWLHIRSDHLQTQQVRHSLLNYQAITPPVVRLVKFVVKYTTRIARITRILKHCNIREIRDIRGEEKQHESHE